ncbi:MAG: hypothetical protein JWO78_569, partial [Micavibrio sp.]|nr:hypothetical protein [Micavibrio sp.]
FKYVASNTYAFDAHKFVQYTRQVSELENENPDTLKKSYKDYFIGQLKGRNKEKTQNFLTVISNFITDEEYSKLLHAFNPPQKLLKAQAGQRCLDALMNFEATLDSEHFPLTKKTIINTIEAYENATLKTRNVPPYKATIRPVLV